MCDTATPKESIDDDWIRLYKDNDGTSYYYAIFNLKTLQNNKIHRQIKKILEE